MTATERAGRVLAKVAAAASAVEEELAEVVALQREVGGDAVHWLPGLREALERVRLECADAQFAARELRQVIPSSDTIQPRLL